MKKRITALLLTLAMLVTFMPAMTFSAFASSMGDQTGTIVEGQSSANAYFSINASNYYVVDSATPTWNPSRPSGLEASYDSTNKRIVITGDGTQVAGEYSLNISGTEHYYYDSRYTKEINMSVMVTVLSPERLVCSFNSIVYDGTAKKPVPNSVYYYAQGSKTGTQLTRYTGGDYSKNKNYYVINSYALNTNASNEATVNITYFITNSSKQRTDKFTQNVKFTINPATIDSIAFTPTDAMYDVTGSTVNASYVVKAGNLNVPDSEYYISGNTSGTAVDDYSFTAVANSDSQNYVGSAIGKWRIVGPAHVDCELDDSGLEYDGTPKAATVKSGTVVTYYGRGETAGQGHTCNDATLSKTVARYSYGYTLTCTDNDTATNQAKAKITVYYNNHGSLYNINSLIPIHEETFNYSVAPRTVELDWDTDLTYNGEEQAPTATVKNIVTGDVVSVTVEGGQTAADTGYTATATGLTGEDASNYVLSTTATDNQTSFDIKSKTVTVTGIAPTGKTYDGSATFDFDVDEAAVTPADIEGEDVVNVVSATETFTEGAYAGENKAVKIVVVLDNNNYQVSDITGTATIAHKAVSVTANDASKYVGEADPETFTATVDGTIGSDTVTYTVTRAEGDEVGTYAITPSGDATQGNYAVTYVQGTFTIKAQTPPGPQPVPVVEEATVTFNVQGHGTAPAAAQVEIGGKVKEPTAPTADGYAFGGWFKDSKCTQAWDFEKDTVAGDMTLYAKWTEAEPIEGKKVTIGHAVLKGDEVIAPTIRVDGEKLSSDDIVVTYEPKVDGFGEYTATITFKGGYYGTIVKKIQVAPQKGILTSAKAGKKKVTAKWKKVAGISGYQVAYKAKGAKKYTYRAVKSSKAVSKTIKKLKKGKRYYVKVRAYKTVNGKRIYGYFSKARLTSKVR